MMSPLDPLKPGELRIRTPHSPGNRRDWAGVITPLILLLVLLVFIFFRGSGGGYPGGDGSSSFNSSYPQKMFVTNPAPRPILPGKYAAFIGRDRENKPEALVFKYAMVRIVTVSSMSEIPIADRGTV